MRSIFGWSYPPGCSGPPDDYERPCEICGLDVGDCDCVECPVCGKVGDRACYAEHHVAIVIQAEGYGFAAAADPLGLFDEPAGFPDEQTCGICGCTDSRACPDGCYWVEPELCSACAEKNPSPDHP